MKKVFIVNPMSGQGRALEIIKYIESKCKENHENYEIIYTSFKYEASSIAKNIIIVLFMLLVEMEQLMKLLMVWLIVIRYFMLYQQDQEMIFIKQLVSVKKELWILI